MRLFGFLFRHRNKRRLTGVCLYHSTERGVAWVVPHLLAPEFTISEKVLRRSGLTDLRQGDRVYWSETKDGRPPRRLYRYRRAPS
jgi:hypothetical protein